MALRALETATPLELEIIIYKVWKSWGELQECSQWAVFTLISLHKSRGASTFENLHYSVECTNALLREHLSVRLKTSLELHLLLKTKLRIDSRENRDAFWKSEESIHEPIYRGTPSYRDLCLT